MVNLLLICCCLLAASSATAQTTTTLNPVADTDTQSDNASGTNPTLSASQWNHLFLKFNLSTISGTITSAKVRIYKNGTGTATLNANNASPDSWTEGGADPTLGTLIASTAMANAAGYYEVDVTSRVVTEAAGDDLITFGMTTNLGSWLSFNSRENASNKPQLVVIHGGGSTPSTKYEAESATLTGTVTATASAGYSGSGYVTSLDNTNDKITFTVNVSSAGSYPLVIRYQNSCGVCEKFQDIKINSAANVYTQFLPTTTGWVDKNYGNVSLNAGNNTIEIIKNWGWTDIDYITVGSGGTGNSLAVSPTSLNVAAAGGNSTINVTSNISWAVTDNQSWMSVSPASGSNNGSFTVNVQSNGGTSSRSGTVTVTGGSLTQSISVTQAGTTPPSGTVTIGTNFWRVDWGNGWTDYYNSGINWSTVTNPWRTDFINDLAPYSVLRFMDWGPTNGSEFVNWSSRIQKTADHYNVTVPLTNGDGSSTTGRGVAYEWQIDLCNRATTDMWITVPHKASDDFVRQLARLIRDNLNSSRKVYVEYSNEVWNWGFDQTNYADAQGTSLGLVGGYPFKGNTIYINAWWGFYVYRACQVARIFEQEFAGQTNRLVKVLAGQLGYDNWPDYVATWGDVHPVVMQHLAALVQPSINPNNVTFDAYALAPYWNGDNLTTMQASIPGLVEKFNEAQRAITNHGPAGLKLVCYEAGQDGGNQVANAQNSGIYNVYIDALNQISAKIQGPLVHYTHVGWDGGHAWGAKQSTSSTLANSHKYRAIVDWVNSHGGFPAPPIEFTAGIESQSVYVYPNPSRGKVLSVDIYADRKMSAEISVTSMNAQPVTSIRKELEEGLNTIQVPVERAKSGIYLVVIDKGFERVVAKVVLE